MKKILIMLAVLATAAVANAQELPQFSYTSFEGWIYNNPGVTLTGNSISQNKVTLYVNSQGLVLTLISPTFSCQGIDTIAATVKWYTTRFTDKNYNVEKTSLTLALDDEQGEPQDSVTIVPQNAATGTHTLMFKLPVRVGVSVARLRFVSWTGDVVSSGAIRWATIEAITTGGTPILVGDVDGDGAVSISDVTMLIDLLLAGGDAPAGADVDGDGSVTIGDVTTLIDLLLNGN